MATTEELGLQAGTRHAAIVCQFGTEIWLGRFQFLKASTEALIFTSSPIAGRYLVMP